MLSVGLLHTSEPWTPNTGVWRGQMSFILGCAAPIIPLGTHNAGSQHQTRCSPK